MKNVLNYYYDIDVSHLIYSSGLYKFNVRTTSYIFTIINRSDEEINELYDLCNELFKLKIPVHEFVLNKNNTIITIYDNKKYVLLKKQKKINELITLNDIIEFSNKTKKQWKYEYIDRTNWDKLWTQKLDYFEYQLTQVGQKKIFINRLWGYYGGIIENCIQIFNIHKMNSQMFSVSHKRIEVGMSFDEFYNPLNFIIDYPIRNIAEYFKSRLSLNIDIYEEIKYYLMFNKCTDYEKLLLFIRMFFPSLQIDILENNILYDNKKKEFYDLMNNNKFYEDSIKKTYDLFNTYVAVDKIEWLN